MSKNGLDLYSQWLQSSLGATADHEKGLAKENIKNALMNSPAYQGDAKVNGQSQPIIATRKETQKCEITVIPDTYMCIGDLVNVFGEYWICVELYRDEYDVQNGKLWLCNHVFKYQTNAGVVVEKYAILDNGSYTSGSDKAITITENSYTCYMPLDDESKELFIDKRLAIAVIQNSKGEEILEVGKIEWIDVKSHNFGEGSHLLLFGIGEDAYNSNTDNIENMICDYNDATPDEIVNRTYAIDGRTTIRNGSSRTYTLTSSDGNEDLSSFSWVLQEEIAGITLTPDGEVVIVTVAEKEELIGISLRLCSVNVDGAIVATIDVEVI